MDDASHDRCDQVRQWTGQGQAAGLARRIRLAVEHRHAPEERERDVTWREADPPAHDRMAHLVEQQ